MGKPQSKSASEQVVIAQNGSTVEAHMSQQSVMMIAILALFAVVVAYVLWRRFQSRARSWLRTQVAAGVAPPAQACAHRPPPLQVLQPAVAPAAVSIAAPVAVAPNAATYT